MQNGVFDVPEHQADVFSVDGGGEVVIQWLGLLLAALFAEALDQKALDVRQAAGIAGKLREIVFDGHLLHFRLQQVRFVQEQDDRNVAEHPVVDNGFEDVEGLAEPVGLPILHQHLRTQGVTECVHNDMLPAR